MTGATMEGSRGALDRLAEAVDADRGVRLLVDRGDGVFEPAASSSGPAPHDEHPPAASPTAGRLRRWLGLPAAARPAGACAHVALPGEPGALLILERTRTEAFTEDDLALARVQGRRLVDRVTTRLGPRPIAWSAQLEAVQTVAAELTRLNSVADVGAALCSQTQRVVAFDNARVYVLHEDGRTLEPVAFCPHAAEYLGESAADLRVGVGEGITGWVAATGQPINVRDAAGDLRTIDIPGSLDLPEESMLLAPLRSEGRVIGVVVLSRLGLDRFSDDELRLLRVLADQAAVAIENARLLSERDRHVAELAALLDLSQAGASASDEDELARALAARLRHAAGMDACLFTRWEEGSGRLLPIGADDWPGTDSGRDPGTDRSARQVLLSDEPLLLDPGLVELELPEQARQAALGASAALLLPLSAAGRVIGLVELLAKRPGRHFHAGEMAWLRSMANQAAATLENARLLRELRDAADTDSVTGVYSHRHLQDRLRQETARAARSGSPLSVLMIDLDDFKWVNDEHGHQAGDRVLRAIASTLRGAVRAGDVVARYGGDEFVVLMPDTDEADAAVVSERAREAVAAIAHPVADGPDVHVSCSVGLALHPRDGKGARDLLRSADAAMYAQKRTHWAEQRAARPTRPTSAAAGSLGGAAAAGMPASVHIEPGPRVTA